MRGSKVKKKKTKVGLFVGTLLTTLGVFLGVFIVAAAGFNFLAGGSDSVSPEGSQNTSRASTNEPRVPFFANLGGILPVRAAEPQRSFALILGVDDTRTDTMMVAAFDPVTSEIALISLPRDSRVTMPPERVEQLRQLGWPVPRDGIMKLNEIHHHTLHADADLAIPFLMMQVEELLDIELDYYVRVDLDAFKFLVDQIGGVQFNVPVRMLYHDPLQNLRIDLQPGWQHLNGYNALNMVRFRSYPSGDDFARMRTQQEFLRAFVSQALSVDNIMSNIPAFIGIALRYVDTNFGISDIPRYLSHLSSFNPDNITTYTLPHTGTGFVNGQDFVFLDHAGIRVLLDDLFVDESAIVNIPSDELRIQILNGGGVSGLANSARELLEINGLSVSAIGDYQGIRADENRIFVSRRGMGADIGDILKNSTVVFDPQIDPRYDIVVVIGRLGLD